jgi:hypothetical protein
MSNSIVPSSTSSPAQAACAVTTQLPLRSIGRPDALTAQRVEVGIVLHAMLGRAAALEYFAKHNVDEAVVQRVLDPAGRRRGSHDANGIRTCAHRE